MSLIVLHTLGNWLADGTTGAATLPNGKPGLRGERREAVRLAETPIGQAQCVRMM